MTQGARWNPVEERIEEPLVVGPAHRLHGLLDSDNPLPGAGEELPPLWHWLYFLPSDPQRALGDAGHPRTGTFLPPAPYPRRMFAGSEVRIERPLRLGENALRTGVASAPVEKRGRSGALAFVDIRYEVTDGSGGRVVEGQQLVYRPHVGRSFERATEEVQAWPWELVFHADERALFRFSALTYNAHRIHYDFRYTTGVEGYAGLVVHGPLVAVGLAEVLRRFATNYRVTRFAFRASQPAFAPVTLRFLGRQSEVGNSAELLAVDDSNVPLMLARADLEPRA